jgi:ubiquinone/menaquinone biosynthesis C-methylase UbiE
MEERFQQETQRLIRSWGRHDRDVLRDYLVRDVEDPRINVQSVLTRHFLLDLLLPGRFAALKEQELRFAVVVNWLLGVLKDPVAAGRHDEILFGLLQGTGEVDDVTMPPYVAETFAALPAEVDGVQVNDYISYVLVRPPAERPDEPIIDEYTAATFTFLWRNVLAREQSSQACENASEHGSDLPSRQPTVLEPACGSANDYRFLDSFGLAARLDYTGFDLCDKNILNARELFPDARFEVGNVLDIAAPAGAYDVCFFHDLLEHLSIEAMEQAVAEICRVTRGTVLAHLFNMHDAPDHEVREVDDYHWNRLSLPRVRALFESHGYAVQATHIDTMLRDRLACGDTHNKHAWTLTATRG